VKRFKFLCRACNKLNRDVEREYCEFCANHTLQKVSVYINDNGEISYFDNPKRRINLRGTKYSIPKPKFGRKNNDLVLREDELMTGQKAINIRDAQQAKRKEEATIQNTLQGNYWTGGQGYTTGVSSLLYEDGAKGGANRKHNVDYKHGYGRKNPNIAKKKV